MAIEKIKELLKAIKTDPEAQAKLGGLVKPSDEDGIVRFYAEAAKKLGFEISEADVRAAVADAAQLCAEKTEAAAEQLSALADDALEQVSGGSKVIQKCPNLANTCQDTYADKENCWTKDGCDKSIQYYSGYICDHNSRGSTCADPSTFDCRQVMF